MGDNGALRPFVPLFRNPHLQTIGARYWPRRLDDEHFTVERKLCQTAAGVQVLVESQRPAGNSRADIVFVHGLEGSSGAFYMRSAALHAVQAGYTAHRMNLRSCGGTEHLAQSVYHGGLTCDVLAVVRAISAGSGRPVRLVGFSLGGNVVAKLAGELADDAKPLLAGVCCASAAIDLAACAHRIGEPQNRVYEHTFVRSMKARARAVFQVPEAELRGIRTVLEMDDRVTARRIGFRDAAEYYRTQSANQYLDRIRVPALFIAARDDTLVPFEIYHHPAFRENPHLRLLATDHGGHVGFIAGGRPRFWLDEAIINWVAGDGTTAPLRSSSY